MKIKNWIFFIVVIFACDNRLDINDDWVDIPVIYAVFNSGTQEDADGGNFGSTIPLTNFNFDGDQDEDLNYMHFVRVQKSFLGSSPAYSYAGVGDSIYYDPDDLSVWVEVFDPDYSGSVEDVQIPLLRVDGLELESFNLLKADGVFNSSEHYLYRLPSETPNVSDLCQGNCNDMSKIYKIFVLNHLTGDTAFSQTNIVAPIKMTRPKPTGSVSVLRFGLDVPLSIEIKPSKNAKMYIVSIRFNYMEQSRDDYLYDISVGNELPTTGIQYKYVDWTLNEEVATEQQLLGLTNNTIKKVIYGSQFFDFLKTQISEQNISSPDFYRYPLNTFYQGTHNGVVAGMYHRCVDLNVTAVNSELYTYLNANAPTSGLNQERPEYNNIMNGIGHVSSRSVLNLNNLRIDQSTMDSLSFGQSTKNLNFACYNTLGTNGLVVNFGFDCEEN